jgi:Tfp pilus assembly protein PilV
MLNRHLAGLSLLELLVSLSLISSSIFAYTQFILKIKAVQYHANKRLNNTLQADYVEKNRRIYNAICIEPDEA